MAEMGIEEGSEAEAEREKTGAEEDDEEEGYGSREGLIRISGTGVGDKGEVYNPGPSQSALKDAETLQSAHL
jgi:hypothetical protein